MQPHLLWGGIGSSEEGKPRCVGMCRHVCILGVRMLACVPVCAVTRTFTLGGWVAYAWQVAAGLRDLGEAERGER